LPELCAVPAGPRCLLKEYSSADAVLPREGVAQLLREGRLVAADIPDDAAEVLR
jgi:hypothetical protein